MANRDFDKIKRTMQDFSLGAGSGEGASGEPKEVETLPEVGEPNVIYKTPDGKLWTCTTETETVCDLEAGKSYNMVETISTDYVINTLMGGIIGNTGSFVEGQEFPKFQVITDAMTGNQDFAYCPVNESNYAYYHIDFEVTPDTVNLQYQGNVTENPDIEITQYFIDNLKEGGTIEDLIPLFQNSSHEEEVPVWVELTAGGDTDSCAVGNIQNKYFDPEAFLELLTAKGVDINETTYLDNTSFKLGLVLECSDDMYLVNTYFMNFNHGCDASALMIENSTVTSEDIEYNSSLKEAFENEEVVEYFNTTTLSTDINYYWMIQWRVGQTDTVNFAYVTPKELETIFYTKE